MKKLGRLCLVVILSVVMLSTSGRVLAEATEFSASVQLERGGRQHAYRDGGSLSLGAFTRGSVTALSGRAGTYSGPGGLSLVRDYGVNSGVGGHGGSYWKLFDRHGKRLGTYDSSGNYLRP